MIDIILLSFFVAVIAGIIGSMIGVGGGIIITPFLSYFNYLPSQISSTSLISVLSTSLSSSLNYWKKKLISHKIGLTLSICAIPGTFIGVIISHFFSISSFKTYFAFILIITAIYLVIKSKYLIDGISNAYKKENLKISLNGFRVVLLPVFSFFAGILSSSFGIGGGIIFVPTLLILLKFDMPSAAATSQFALFFTSIAGLILYVYYGYPDYYIGFILSTGSILGGFLGSKLSTKINSSKLQKLFSIVLVLVSIKLLYDGIR